MTSWLRFAGLILLASVAMAPRALAQTEARIGYVNSERILSTYQGFLDAQTAYETEFEAWMAELKSREQELTQMEADFRAQEPMLTDDKRREKELTLQRVAREYEDYRQSVFGAGGRAERRNQEILEPVLADVRHAVEKIATEQEYHLIFDAVDGNLVYGDPEYDITDLVLAELSGSADAPVEDPAVAENPESEEGG